MFAGRCDLDLQLTYCTHAMVEELYKVFTGRDMPVGITFPADVLSPAAVSSVLLTHRLDGETAISILQAKCNKLATLSM